MQKAPKLSCVPHGLISQKIHRMMYPKNEESAKSQKRERTLNPSPSLHKTKNQN